MNVQMLAALTLLTMIATAMYAVESKACLTVKDFYRCDDNNNCVLKPRADLAPLRRWLVGKVQPEGVVILNGLKEKCNLTVLEQNQCLDLEFKKELQK